MCWRSFTPQTDLILFFRIAESVRRGVSCQMMLLHVVGRDFLRDSPQLWRKHFYDNTSAATNNFLLLTFRFTPLRLPCIHSTQKFVFHFSIRRRILETIVWVCVKKFGGIFHSNCTLLLIKLSATRSARRFFNSARNRHFRELLASTNFRLIFSVLAACTKRGISASI